jgi:RNA polymerase sigma-70 factor (ECF subfamily)
MAESPPPHPADDRFAALLADARAGDRAAIARLYREHNPALVRFLEARAAGSGADLAQDTWLSACTSLAGFDGGAEQFRAWLFTIARRRVADHWRRVGRQPVTTNGPPDPETVAARDATDDGITTHEAIAELVRHLSADQAEVLLLRVVADMSVEEVAGIVGKSPGAVRVMQHRALRRLAAELVDETSGPSAAIPRGR